MERKRERRKGKLLNLVFSAFFLIYHFLHLELPQQTKKFEAFSDKGGGLEEGWLASVGVMPKWRRWLMTQVMCHTLCYKRELLHLSTQTQSLTRTVLTLDSEEGLFTTAGAETWNVSWSKLLFKERGGGVSDCECESECLCEEGGLCCTWSPTFTFSLKEVERERQWMDGWMIKSQAVCGWN